MLKETVNGKDLRCIENPYWQQRENMKIGDSLTEDITIKKA